MISFDEFLKQDEADKYNMLQECNAIIQQKENKIKEVREKIHKAIIDSEIVGNGALNLSELLEILDKGE